MDLLNLQLGTSNLFSSVVTLLGKHAEWLNAKVKFFVPHVDLGPRNESPDPAQHVVRQLSRLSAQGLDTWQAFVHCVCMELDVPLELEVPLLSTWGHEDNQGGIPHHHGSLEESCPESQCRHGLKRPHQSCESSPRRKKQYKEQQLEFARPYLQLLRTSTQQHYDNEHPRPGQPLSFHVAPILQQSRVPAPLDTQEQAIMGDLVAEDGIRDLFHTSSGKGRRVTVVLGKAGMGKTTLAHWLCRKWAGGQLERFEALFLFEFRQLNQISGPLTLPQLLFDQGPRPESRADIVFQYLQEHASRVLLIFDGLDEALWTCPPRKMEDPDAPLPAFTLFSGLCNGTLLPGCWVMATSRPGKLPECLPVEAARVHMWGFDRPRVEEYVGRFFRGQPLLQAAAMEEVRADGRLWSMCAVPALCQVACKCLHHLLPDVPPGQAATLLPTITQLFVQRVRPLSPHKFLLGLSEVALQGLQAGKVVFLAGDISPSMLAFGATHSLLTSFSVRTGPRGHQTGYAFAHLSLQEFLAALQLMVSPQVDKDSLSGYITLHSHWTLRTNASLGLLDHLPTFLAGLASSACRPFLGSLAQQGGEAVAAKQTAVVQTLMKLTTRRLRAPKFMQLCHCVGETQEPELARLAAQNLPCPLAFHNLPLTYTDLAALANILSYRDAPIHLDFEGCPLEPHCPEALVGCEQVEHLSFQSRKCGDSFAEALSRSLPKMKGLRKLGFTGSRITPKGLGHLLEALALCPQLEELSLQNNHLKDREVLDVVRLLPGLPRLQRLDLSRNIISESSLLSLIKVVVMCPAIRMLQAGPEALILLFSPFLETPAELHGAPDPRGNASRKEEAPSGSWTLRLPQCQLQVHHVETLSTLLRGGPCLEEVDLSGNQLEDEGCRLMAEAASQLHIIRKLDLSDNGLSLHGVHSVLGVLHTCWTLSDLHISLLHKRTVLTFARDPEEKEEEEAGSQQRAAFLDTFIPHIPSELPQSSRRIRLTHCGFQAKHLVQLCKALAGSCHLSCLYHLDLSDNALGDEGAGILAQLLPCLGTLQSLNLSRNGLSLDAVFTLARAFSTLEWVFHVDISVKSQRFLLRGDRRPRDALPGEPGPECPARAQFLGLRQPCSPRTFRLRECQLEPSSLTCLFSILEKCSGPLEVELSSELLSDPSLETLLDCSIRLPQLSLLQLSHTELAPRSPLLLANVFRLCPRVQKVELRSLRHMSLHFKFLEEEGGVNCGFLSCGLLPEHVEPLCSLLSKCEDVSQLILSGNLLGDEGFKRLLECLPRVPISGVLDLSHNNLSLESALLLVETLPSCLHAREALVNLGSEHSFRIYFSRQEGAGKVLRLTGCSLQPEHVPRLAGGLSQAPQLAELTLTRCGLDPKQLTVLLSLVRRPAGLLCLQVEEPWIRRAGLSTLLRASAQASDNVTKVSISETQQQLCVQLEFPCRADTPDAVALRLAPCDFGNPSSPLVRVPMETYARLQQLSLSQVNLSDVNSLLLQNFLLSLSELKTFRLTSSYVSIKGLTHLASGLSHCRDLEELDLSNNPFGEEAGQELVKTLAGKCRLKRLDLSNLPLGSWSLDTLIKGLRHMVLLKSLTLSRNCINDVGCRNLAEALRGATSLEDLDLSHNRIGEAGTQHLAAVLPELPQLRAIDLSANGIGPVGGRQLAESLSLCRNLEELRLGNNALEDPTVCMLARGLPQHLRVLCLSSSCLSPEGVLPLGQALGGCPHMEEISLAENTLGQGLAWFSKGFPLLRQIDLISCEIDNQAAKPLAAGFLLCPALEEILLSWNLLGDQAAAELACVLPSLGRLKRVDLERNQITACGARLLAKGLARVPGTQVIRLWSNPIPPTMAQHLQSQEPRLDFAFFEDRPRAPSQPLQDPRDAAK
ncbi:protein NLRC5 isoform X2 [Tenrec ecaudatus]|uniref:protein NLRC5 isoform X2 n=1 Tax=Tenrec ecaudatus TaxID=94439 RepID=UPI003F59B776